MTVQTISRSATALRVGIQCVLFVTNELLGCLYLISDRRGLGADKISQDKEMLTNGLHTWLSTKHLKAVLVEITDMSRNLVEKWQWNVEYIDRPDAEPASIMNRLEEVLSGLRALPAGCKLRVIVTLHDGAPNVKGWTDTSTMDDSHLRKTEVGQVISKKITSVFEFLTQVNP